jgi:hypothetical protein
LSLDNDFKPKKLATKNLRLTHVPRRTPQEWLTSTRMGDDWSFINFANSFDGYEFLDDELGTLANAVANIYGSKPNVLDAFNLRGLRALLFFEQRRAKWAEQNRVSDYTKALVKMIRRRLTS